VAAVSLGTVLGLIVSVLALIATVAIGLLRFRHERILNDRADARSTLAEGALELGRMKSVMKDALTAFTKPLETGEGWPNDYGEEIGRLEKAAEAWRRRWPGSAFASSRTATSWSGLTARWRRRAR